MSAVHHIFVYGTLRRGQCREHCWPQRPVRIEEATIRAALSDLGPYPAIGAGDDVVRVELWEIAEDQLEETLRVLDEVEGYSQDGNDLYVRRLVACHLRDGREVEVWTYYYGNEPKLR